MTSAAYGVARVVSFMALISAFRLIHTYSVIAVKIVSLVPARKFADDHRIPFAPVNEGKENRWQKDDIAALFQEGFCWGLRHESACRF
ncbi:MAG: hypothetical protein HYZ77_00410 [Serratia liquefaciens]|nr:hypothetical protein [Serratia liquefaciens]